MMIRRTSYLTQGFSDVLERQIRTTHAGQAHFAGSGPPGATCGDCAFLGYHWQVRNEAGNTVKTVRYGGCEKYHQLTGKDGPVVPRHAAACRHFERKKEDGRKN